MKSPFNTMGRVLLLVLLAALGASAGLAQPPSALRQSFDVRIPVPPTPFKILGKVQLVYELHISNFSRDELELTRLEVLDVRARRAPLGDFKGLELASRIARPGTRLDPSSRRTLAPGTHAVLYLWLTLDSTDATPAALKHRIEFDVIRATPATPERAVVEGAVTGVETMPAVVLDPPLRGGPWAAIYDDSWERGHRRSLFAVGGRAQIPARLAIDWVKLDKDGKSARGDSERIANWYGYAADVLAVADGVVADTRDGVAESPTLADASAPRRTLDEGSGNYVALDLGRGRFAFYEHLKPGSIRVKVGDRVRSGQVIAALGYTGDSTGPHLHFHVSDANATLAAEGRPFALRGFTLLGAYPTIEAFAEGKPWSPPLPGVVHRRHAEMPAPLSVVEFGADAGDKN